MLDEESALKTGTGSLMTSFVRALDIHQRDELLNMKSSSSGGQSQSKGLSIDEIFGNIFVINFAGHDTTANTLAFSMLLLAANPDVQDWVADELRGEKWNYNVLFSALKRCRAVLVCIISLSSIYLQADIKVRLETLRLYPPIMALPKWSSHHPQALHIGESTIIIPPQTGIMPSLLAVQTHPKYWPDSLVWQPSRWISSPASQPELDITTQLLAEALITPMQSKYFPWSDGPQNCPGAKFA